MSRCVLCGRPNACAIASEGASGAECWCQHVEFTPDVFAKIPLADRGRGCVCRDCVALITIDAAAPSSPIGDFENAAAPTVDAGEARAEMLRTMLSEFDREKHGGEVMADAPVGNEAFAPSMSAGRSLRGPR